MGIHDIPTSAGYTGLENSPIIPYCSKVGNILSLKGQTSGILSFEGGIEGWGVDNHIKVHYGIKINSQPFWQDKDSVEGIEVENIYFEGCLNGEKLGISDEKDIYVELYFEKMGINIEDEIRKAYYGEE